MLTMTYVEGREEGYSSRSVRKQRDEEWKGESQSIISFYRQQHHQEE